MCKIDYLGTGVCASGSSNHYVSYYPQGRMDLYAALGSGLIPVTATLKDVIETCNLCGVCDMQCHFYTGMRPSVVMKGLKDYLAKYIECGEIIHDVETNATLEAIRTIVGKFWATNDPAIRITYAHDPSPLSETVLPAYVVLPRSREEVAEVLRLALQKKFLT